MKQFNNFTYFIFLVATMYTSQGITATIRALDQSFSLNYVSPSGIEIGTPIDLSQTQMFTVDKFNNTKGTLTGVIFTTNIWASNSATIKSTLLRLSSIDQIEVDLRAFILATTPYDQVRFVENNRTHLGLLTPGDVVEYDSGDGFRFTHIETATSLDSYSSATNESFNLLINLSTATSISKSLTRTVLAAQHDFEAKFTIDYVYDDPVASVPLPAATWLMISGLLGIFAFSRNKLKVSG